MLGWDISRFPSYVWYVGNQAQAEISHIPESERQRLQLGAPRPVVIKYMEVKNCLRISLFFLCIDPLKSLGNFQAY